jgi:hypothetical protein
MRLSALWLCVAWLAPARAQATVVLPADFAELVSGSQLVVHGRVALVRAQEINGRRSIETIVTVTVADVLKGQPGGTVTFRIPGGEIGRYRRVMVGAPRLAAGDEIVVFLRGSAPALPVVFGLSQGLYRVVRGADGRALVTPPLVTTSAPGAIRIVRGDPARQPVPIEVFARAVRAQLEPVP